MRILPIAGKIHWFPGPWRSESTRIDIAIEVANRGTEAAENAIAIEGGLDLQPAEKTRVVVKAQRGQTARNAAQLEVRLPPGLRDPVPLRIHYANGLYHVEYRYVRKR